MASSSSSPIIIFGPTGNVGRHAALAAGKRSDGNIILAMRDPAKSIPGLDENGEKKIHGKFERVKADLTDVESVKNVVEETGAKKAFIYLVHSMTPDGKQDHMKGAIEALKEGGVEFVVFLSSYTVREPLENIPSNDIIPYGHAQIELQLLSIFGKANFVAIRPGGFATNIQMWHGDEIKTGKLKMQAPDAKFDGITAEDMGEVVGNILAKKQTDVHAVYLFGPKMLSRMEQARIVETALGKQFEIEEIGEEEAVKQYLSKGVPEVFAKYLAGKMGEIGDSQAVFAMGEWEEGVKNVERFTGRPAIGFEEWVGMNLERFRTSTHQPHQHAAYIMASAAPSRMQQLASIIAQHSAQLEAHVQTGPSLSDDHPSAPFARLPPELDHSRRTLMEAAADLRELLMQPLELVMHHHEHPFWFYEILWRFKIPARVPLDGSSVGYAELAATISGLDEATLKSVLRYAIAHHVFAEKTPGQVSHTPASRLLAVDENASALTAVMHDEVIKPALYSADALLQASNGSAKTAFMLAENTSAPDFWTYLAQHPERLDRFVRVMAAGTDYECDIIANGFAWPNYRTVVECGGSRGEFSAQLAQRFPHLAITVQDLPHVVGDRCKPESCLRNVRLMAHDFFQPQPVRDADVYLFRHCFHDWNDEACVRILRALAPAMKEGARLLIVDAILPEPGEVPLHYERRIRSIDNNMRHVLGSKERSIEEWQGLFTTADGRFDFIKAVQQPLGLERTACIAACISYIYRVYDYIGSGPAHI
ncbi:hypothetical protein BST61_g8699 [Cercospora zeina]